MVELTKNIFKGERFLSQLWRQDRITNIYKVKVGRKRGKQEQSTNGANRKQFEKCDI